jgi:Mrp family chromosome partitioning ATPase/predicted Fe-Mo cluster-binding NifX family protein
MADKKCESCSGQSEKQQQGYNPDSDNRLQGNLSRIKNKIVVLSGKGGVGKSSVAANLAVGLSLNGKKVGLMDVDVHGPSIPRLLSLSEARPEAEDNSMTPIRWSDNLSAMSIGFLLPNKDDSVIWRGPLKMQLIRQFISEVSWGDMDYLVVDCPPGTGDEPISVMQLIGKDAKAVIVTTPQHLSTDDVRRSINFCHHTENPILGLVENMSGFVCPHCQKAVDIFSAGGGQILASETGVPFLGRIPLDPEMVRSGDNGYAFIKTHPDHPTGQAIQSIVDKIIQITGSQQTQANQATEETATQQSQSGQNGNLKIAIPIADGKLCSHFGHCQQFALASVNQDKKNIEDIQFLNPPPHEPGALPKWLAEHKANIIIAGGMGSMAQNHFSNFGIQVVVGSQDGTPEELINAYLNGTLKSGENLCDH